MKNQIRKECHLALLTLTVWSSHAWAESTLLSTPWQIGSTIGGVLPEDLRGVSPGPLARTWVGIPLRPGAYVDASVFVQSAAGQGGNPRERTLGAGADLRLERLGDRFNFLFLVGGGYGNSKRGSETINAPYANIGWGLGYELTRDFSLRYEMRGIARFNEAFIPGRSLSYDATASVGWVYSFGQKAPTPYTPRATSEVAAQPPVTAPETALPPPPLVVPSARVVARVISPEDLCPPAPAASLVDANGCLSPQKLILPRTEFFDSAEATEIRSTGDAALAAVAAALVKNPVLFADISVHTDTAGFGEDNLKTSSAQAALLSQRLFQLGAAPDRLSTEGLGEERPIANEDTEVGIEKNQRVEIKITTR